MVINHNMSSMFANRVLNVNNDEIQGNIEKLSSGEKINRSGDDASGLAVSEKMRAQIRGLNRASKNLQDGISFIQTTEGYLNETTEVLHRLRELAIQAANGIYTDEDRMMIQVEVSQLVAEVDRVASHAQFNGFNMLTGRFAREGGEIIHFHVGANMDQRVYANVESMTASALGLRGGQGGEAGEGVEGSSSDMLTFASSDSANAAIGTIDAALQIVNKQRADLGAYQNRFEIAVKGIDIAAENTQASESRIRDTNMASEMVGYTRNMILTQAGTAMLAQANNQTQGVLSLLR